MTRDRREDRGVDRRDADEDRDAFVHDAVDRRDGVEARHRRHARAGEEWCGQRGRETEELRIGEERQDVIASAELRGLHRLPRVREQVAMREDRAERAPGHGRGIDDHALLVAAGFVAVALQCQAEVRAEVHARTRPVARHDLRRDGCIVEQHMHRAGRQARRERAEREHGTRVRVVHLVCDLRTRRERVHEHRPSALARRERHQELRRRRQEDRRAAARERAHERRTPLQQREARGDETRRGDAIDRTAAGGGAESQQVHETQKGAGRWEM